MDKSIHLEANCFPVVYLGSQTGCVLPKTGAPKAWDKHSYSIPKGNIRKEERGNRSLGNPKL